MNQQIKTTIIAVAAGVALAACITTGATAASRPPHVSKSRPSAALVRACRADTRVVDISVNVLQALNPNTYQHFTAARWKTVLLERTLPGGPLLQQWPDSESAHYSISVAPATPFTTSGDHVKTVNGDVILTVASSGLTYDATVHPNAACAAV